MKLGVNIDHVATLREARYRGHTTGEPSPIEAARICEAAGAHGITAHLREDRRHIQDRDVRMLRDIVNTRLNLEMTNTPEIVDIALGLKPDIVCVVPERRQEVTTEGGLDAVGQEAALSELQKRMNDAGIEVSLFIAPDPRQVEAAARIGSQFIELHTGQFAEHHGEPRLERRSPTRREVAMVNQRAGSETGAPVQGEAELQRLIDAAELAHRLGLRVNAGHGLNYENVKTLFAVPHLVELNIGHSIISRAVFSGLGQAVRDMLAVMKGYPS